MRKHGEKFQIAILLYPGVTALDAVGPWEVWSGHDLEKARLVDLTLAAFFARHDLMLLKIQFVIRIEMRPVRSPFAALSPGGSVRGTRPPASETFAGFATVQI